MIDIHTHLLYNVDDGSRDSVETLTNLKVAEKAGFTDIIFTPHYIEEYYENSIELLRPKYEELKSKVQDNNIHINIHKGNEVYFSDEICHLLESGEIATLAGSRYLLFELPQHSKVLTLTTVIMQIEEMGAIPVLAHPERYEFVQENVNVLRDLISRGVLMQSNYGSIIGQYGKNAQKTIVKMLKNNMIHFLGTDVHRTGYIYAHFDKVEKEFLKYISKEKFEELTTTNAENILSDTVFEIEEPTCVRRKLFFA